MKRSAFSLCLVVILTACKTGTPEPKVDVVRSVKFQEVSFQSYLPSRDFSGVVRSTQTSPLSFKVSGTIEHLFVKKGQKVLAGKPLAKLETKDFVLAVKKAQASLGAATAAKVQVQDKYERSLKLNQNQFVSVSELNSIQADYDAKKQQQALAQTDLSNAQLNLERTQIFAPFNGQVSEVFVEEFTKTSSGQPIIELVNHDEFQIDFLIPESLVSRIRLGQKVDVSIPVLNDAKLKATVSEIGAVVKKGNAYAITLALDSQIPNLRNGMSANVTLSTGTANTDIVRLPLTAFDYNDTSGEGKAALYVIEPKTFTLSKRYVSVMKEVNNHVVVTDQLKEGDKVVVAGVPYLYEGQRVALWHQE
ncbi:efflux RND transporter periplasmic adaptor subunit [Vibrio rotiferianus]|uniref:efflux RND transporter periplasmic adaptor subunit n=1 Tax=Vibrio rotiferianus TaxID=190895 RepID=UPI001485CA7A|nr:efflux RND transporter periplasmic adaptor subunit [Vibrio rotiferianus]